MLVVGGGYPSQAYSFVCQCPILLSWQYNQKCSPLYDNITHICGVQEVGFNPGLCIYIYIMCYCFFFCLCAQHRDQAVGDSPRSSTNDQDGVEMDPDQMIAVIALNLLL